MTVDYRPSVLRSPRGGDDWFRLIAHDDGAAFLAWLAANPARVPNASSGLDGWFLRVGLEQSIDRLSGLALPADENSAGDDTQIEHRDSDPGPFHGEIHAFDLSAESRREAQPSDYSRLVRDLAGVRVYRDGFAIRPYGIDHDDWLQLVANGPAARRITA